jgi:hypothetical protein
LLTSSVKHRIGDSQLTMEFLDRYKPLEIERAYFATHPDMVLELFGRYCEDSGLELKQAA